MPSDQIRLLLVEDVPQVAQYVRGLLNNQTAIKLVDIQSDGTRVPALVTELRPDVVLIDSLLQGRVKGPQLMEQMRSAMPGVPIIAITVPQNPLAREPEKGIDAVLSMPFTGFELATTVKQVHQEARAHAESGDSRIVAVFAPKGGVGKTTVAFNLACSLAQSEERTVLVDGSLQFGDLRALLRVPLDAPSILDLPTDRIAESDLNDVLWRDPSGTDILLAPPRIEQAEMVTTRDVEKILSMLRRVYKFVIIDCPAALSDISLTYLDQADLILEIVTFDSTTIHSTIAMANTFRQLGYPPTKVRYVVNRYDSAGGISPDDLARALGRVPEHRIISDGRLVVQANNSGMPFVLAEPDAPVSRDLAGLAAEVVALGRPSAAARR
jgi:pilus assembly protein CpaE